MRTTLTIDDDVLIAAKERARREQRSTGAVISDLARKALSGAASSHPGERRIIIRDGFPVLEPRGGIVTDELIRRLMDEEDS